LGKKKTGRARSDGDQPDILKQTKTRGTESRNFQRKKVAKSWKKAISRKHRLWKGKGKDTRGGFMTQRIGVRKREKKGLNFRNGQKARKRQRWGDGEARREKRLSDGGLH